MASEGDRNVSAAAIIDEQRVLQNIPSEEAEQPLLFQWPGSDIGELTGHKRRVGWQDY